MNYQDGTDPQIPDRPAIRTQTQREASRRNGARSQGPRTIDGKARSRLNAMKHGLLARQIAPPADYRGDDQAYLRIRRALIEEFEPQGFAANATVDSLAHDYLFAGRCRQMIEAAMRPQPLPERDESRWQTLQEIRHALPALEQAREALDAGKSPHCSQKVARRLADVLLALLEQIDADLQEEAEAAADNAADASGSMGEREAQAPEDPFEYDQEGEFRTLVDTLGDTGRRRLSDRGYLMDVLSGGRAKRGDLKRLNALIVNAIDNRHRWLKWHGASLVQQADRLVAANSERLAAAPEQMEGISRYLAEAERRIERKVQELRTG